MLGIVIVMVAAAAGQAATIDLPAGCHVPGVAARPGDIVNLADGVIGEAHVDSFGGEGIYTIRMDISATGCDKLVCEGGWGEANARVVFNQVGPTLLHGTYVFMTELNTPMMLMEQHVGFGQHSGPTHYPHDNILYTERFGQYDLTMRVEYGWAAMTVTVTESAGGTNRPPLCYPRPSDAGHDVRTAVNTPVQITPAGIDYDGIITSYAYTQPAHGTVTRTGSNVTYTPATNYNGIDWFTMKPTDNGGATGAVARINLVVGSAINTVPLNSIVAPYATSQPVTTPTNTPKAITLAGADLDGTIVSYAYTQPAHGTVTGTGPNVTYTPAAGYSGNDSFTFTVTDNVGAPSTEAAIVLISVGESTQCAAPTFSPAPGTYGSAQSVTISTTTSGASIRYTTDGSTPSDTVGTEYTEPVGIALTTTLKAIACKADMANSSVTTGSYTFGLGSIEYLGMDATYKGLSINGDWVGNVGADGYHLLYWNGAENEKSCPPYLGPATIATSSGFTAHKWAAAGGTTDVRACKDHLNTQRSASCWYTTGTGYMRIPVQANKTFILGVYMLDWDQPANLRTANLSVCDFTEEASPPSTIATGTYHNPPKWFFWRVTACSGDTISIRVQATNNNAAVAALTFDPVGEGGQCAAPTFDPAAGTYGSSQPVTISTTTTGATIKYTTNGTDPSRTVGTEYTSPVSISASTTVKAIAYKTGMDNSTVTSGYYTIVSLPGDVNGDCVVSILDMLRIRDRLGQDPAVADNWNADVNGDTKINILDLIYVRNRLNNACP